MSKIVTLGEIMLRLSPAGNDRFIQTENFRIIPGGGEANVAISCANYGHEAVFVSKLPKHEIGQIAVNALRRNFMHNIHFFRHRMYVFQILLPVISMFGIFFVTLRAEWICENDLYI